MLCGRSLGSLAIIWPTRSLKSGVTFLLTLIRTGMAAVRCLRSSSSGLIPVNGNLPLNNSYSMHPKLYMSVRPSSALPRICSGAM